jgi:F-type H+-transporting ATPase subunit epsilon
MAPETTLATFSCQVLTPTRTVGEFDRLVSAVFLAADGDFQLEARHEPVLLPLKVGVATFTTLSDNGDTKEEKMAIHGGFLDMNGKSATVFTYAAEAGAKLDLERLNAAEKRAQERLNEVKQKSGTYERIDVDRAQRALARAICRKQLVGS